MTTSRRSGDEAALAAGIVQDMADLFDLLGRAIGRVAPLGRKDPATLGGNKRTVYRDVVAALVT